MAEASECTAYLMMCDGSENHNKVYIIMRDPKNPSMLKIQFGRYGSTLKVIYRPATLFWQTYYDKIDKGYVDVTDMFNVHQTSENDEYAPIEDPVVDQLINDLLMYSNQSVHQNYSIDFNQVTDAMVAKAQDILVEIGYANSVGEVNELLQELFTVLPRKMKNVSDYLATDMSQLNDILTREQQTLDAMSASVLASKKPEDEQTSKDKQTLLDVMGVEITVAGPDAIRKTKQHLGSEYSDKVVNVFRVHNKNRDKKFWDYARVHNIKASDFKYLYHGTSNSSILSIINDGGMTKHKRRKNGNMFSEGSEGMYLAVDAGKSLGYSNMDDAFWTNRHGKQQPTKTFFLLVCKCAFINPMNVYSYTSACSHLNAETIAPYDALYAHAGAGFLYHDEIVLYNEDQITLQYLIEFKN